MSLFRKPIARVYVDQLRHAFDDTTVPIFTPDTDIEVGYFGSFDEGRFVKRGKVEDLGVQVQVDQHKTGGFKWASGGAVSFGPSVEIPGPSGEPLIESTVHFESAKSVAVSYPPGTERSVRDADAFGRQLMNLWSERQLRTDRVVVWAVRHAPGGTVIISRERNNTVEVVADAGLLGAAAGISLSSLAVGVDFGAQSGATWALSERSTPLVVWARVLKIDDKTKQAVDAFGFEATEEFHLRLRDERPAPFRPDELLANLAGDTD